MLLTILVLTSACSPQEKGSEEGKESKKTVTYQSEKGPVEVPAHPKRVVVLASFTGNVMSLGTHLVGVDPYAKMNPLWKDRLKDVPEVSDENLEKIVELNPDLIIGLSNTKNQDKLKEIAPTVIFTYNKLDYLNQHIEIGKVLNKEKEATAWVEDFKKRSKNAGQEIKDQIGEDATVSVIENFDKQLSVFGDAWGRGTEVLYQEMELNMPKKVKEKALKTGYHVLSPEVLPEFAGDYLVISKNNDYDSSYMKTKTFKNIPAVKKDRVFVVDTKKFLFNDPLSLDYQLKFFKEKFLGKAEGADE
ncbi:iron-hydroxamate ABC transporter substrate-binding protein [Kroppenstedtia eburnea]|uniref:iron-hydroxamate ABC transporter substrate-binding protein n=1 Tax=Kroppenstedtia eburnea TaxID=714067 RepID=UPI00363BB193